MHGFKTYGYSDSMTFPNRRARLVEVATALKQEVFDVVLADNKPIVQFVPSLPHVSMVHVHIRVPLEVATAARDYVAATTGKLAVVVC
jgi:hypothetical protein